MALIRLDIQTIVVGGGPVSSLMILKTHASDNIHTKNHNGGRLPIQIGPVEAMSIGTGVNSSSTQGGRPMTHDLLAMTIKALGATLDAVVINAVEGTTFFAQLRLIKSAAWHSSIAVPLMRLPWRSVPALQSTPQTMS